VETVGSDDQKAQPMLVGTLPPCSQRRCDYEPAVLIAARDLPSWRATLKCTIDGLLLDRGEPAELGAH
jgi:hypothetical protein